MKSIALTVVIVLGVLSGCSKNTSPVGPPPAGTPTPSSGTWSIQVVDSSGFVGSFAHLAVDTAGHVAISYLDNDTRAIRCARLVNGKWVINDVGDATGPYVSKGNNSIALKADGTPVITFHKADVAYYYTSLNGGTWTTPVAIGWDQPAWAFLGSNAVGVDKASGEIYSVMSLDDAKGYAVLGYWHSSTSQAVAIDGPTLGKTGTQVSLAVDDGGNVHVAYEYQTDGSSTALLKYAKLSSGAWSYGIVDSMGDGGDNTSSLTSIATDQAGTPHIAYYRLNDGYRYAHWNGSRWEISLIASYGTVGWNDQSIAVDNAGNPHVALLMGYYKLVYAYRSGGTWVQEVVDPNTGYGCSIGVDGKGKVYIAYYDDNYHQLKLAVRTP
jgi:hypothetical protein